jgi:pyruvate dehydrogenase E2 component (dihydrolipoamide acetyltransferase)
MTIFKLPDLGEGLSEAEIHEWYIQEGDSVKIDQPLVSMETAKAVVDIPSPVEGRIVKLHGKPGDIIPTGAPLIEFSSQDSPRQDAGTVVGAIETSDAILVESAIGVTHQAKKAIGQGVKATPAVRQLAKTLNVNLEAVQGTGINGTITADDVKQAANSAQPVAQDHPGEAVHGPRRAMAHNMAQSHAQVVPVTLMEDADIHRWPEKTDTTLRLIQAIVSACQAEPALNAHFYATPTMRYQRWSEINLGIAVDTPGGLYVPVIKDAAAQSPEALRSMLNAFKEKAKAQSFVPADLSSATITLSNFGSIVGRYASPIVVPPTIAIVGIGKTRTSVVAWEGKPAIHPVIPISLTFDHRAVTGGEAARFMMALIQHLEGERG